MAGRTHGQPGAPITFGFKVASWADEVRRHIARLAEGRSRWVVGQLGGAVGVLGFFAPHGLALRAEFCRELGLGDPGMSWLTARDRIAEFGGVLALICGTLARIGDEVYELQRPEIGELREPTTPDTVGSITMPHKRNPEGSEHLDTLARLVRTNAAVLYEGMVGTHERDGRSWKAEWVALPEICLLAGVALQQAQTLLAGLIVDAEAMRENLARFGDQLTSEHVLAELTPRLGKHQAQQLMHDAARTRAGRGPRRRRRSRHGRRRGRGRPGGAHRRLGDRRRRGDGRRCGRTRPGRASVRTRGVDVTPRRVPLACLPTPLVPAPRLAEILGSGPLWIKRDDLTGFAVAGNKARALEYLLGDALDSGCDVLVAAGSVSSNFCAAAAVAARRCGLDCELLLSESASAAGSTNVAIARAVGALLHFDAAPTRETLDDRPLGPRGRAPSGGSAALSTAARWGDTHRCGRLRLCRPGDRRAKRRARHPARHRGCRRPGPAPLRLDWSLARRDTDFNGMSSARR